MKTEDGDQVNIPIELGSLTCRLGVRFFADSTINPVIDHFLVFLVL